MQKYDIGTVFEVTMLNAETGAAIDISAVTTKQIIFGSPGGTVKTRLGTFSTTGTDGKLKYQVIANDIDEAGDWTYQGKVVWASGESFHSPKKQFKVLSNIESPSSSASPSASPSEVV